MHPTASLTDHSAGYQPKRWPSGRQVCQICSYGHTVIVYASQYTYLDTIMCVAVIVLAPLTTHLLTLIISSSYINNTKLVITALKSYVVMFFDIFHFT